MINVYSNDSQFALKYLKDTKANIHNILVITGNFNIRDSDWNSLYLFYSMHSDLLVDIVDSFDLMLLYSTNQVFTRYLDNANNTNSVINLIFLRSNSSELDNHIIYLELYYITNARP